MKSLRVTVGIPFYNNADTLLDAVRSVFAQTFTDWELILMDDGSSDASLALAQRVRDPRVIVLSDGINRGLVYRLNQMTDLARGDSIARMDGDDLMHPERLVRQVAYLDAHPQVDLVGSAIYSLNSKGDVAGSRNHGEVGRTPDAILAGKGLAHPSVTGRAVWFRGNLYDPRFVRCQDLAKAVGPDCRIKTIGIRPGERLFEEFIAEEEAPHTIETKDSYVVLSKDQFGRRDVRHEGTLLPAGFHYDSAHNDQWLSEEQLRRLVGEYLAERGLSPTLPISTHSATVRGPHPSYQATVAAS